MDKEPIDIARMEFRKECNSLGKVLDGRLEKLSKFSFRKLIKRLSRADKKPKSRIIK